MSDKPFTFRDLKQELSKLTDEQLDNKVVVYREDEGLHISGLDVEPHDRYVNIDEPEDQGSLEQLKEWHGDEFVLEDYTVVPKGRPFLCEDF